MTSNIAISTPIFYQFRVEHFRPVFLVASLLYYYCCSRKNVESIVKYFAQKSHADQCP